MKIRATVLALACAFALSGCETISDAWDDVFGYNDNASATTIAEQTSGEIRIASTTE